MWCTRNAVGLFAFSLRLADVSNFQHKFCFIQILYMCSLPLAKLSRVLVRWLTSKLKTCRFDIMLQWTSSGCLYPVATFPPVTKSPVPLGNRVQRSRVIAFPCQKFCSHTLFHTASLPCHISVPCLNAVPCFHHSSVIKVKLFNPDTFVKIFSNYEGDVIHTNTHWIVM
jgi:hypothetical protein